MFKKWKQKIQYKYSLIANSSYNLMISMEEENIEGEEIELTREMLEGIDLEIYGPGKEHFLAFALQNGRREVNLKNINKTETKNQRKQNHQKIVRSRRAIKYNVPKKYGPQPNSRRRRNKIDVKTNFSSLLFQFQNPSFIGPNPMGLNPMTPIMGPMHPVGLLPPSMCQTPPFMGVIPMMGQIPPLKCRTVLTGMPCPNDHAPHVGMPVPSCLLGMGMPFPNLMPASIPKNPLMMKDSSEIVRNQSNIPPNSSPSSQPTPQIPTLSTPLTDSRRSPRPQRQKIKISSISLPPEIVRKQKNFNQKTKKRSNCFKIYSPALIVLKAKRRLFIQVIAEERKMRLEIKQQKQGIEQLPIENKSLPEYFRKKKASQKRRRQEKHEMIKANRKALVQLFGDAVFQSRWPVSRKEINLALGIEEEDGLKTDGLAEFYQMVERDETKQSSIEQIE